MTIYSEHYPKNKALKALASFAIILKPGQAIRLIKDSVVLATIENQNGKIRKTLFKGIVEIPF